MNVLERVERALSDSGSRLNPAIFEECATALLTPLYPNLVPIRGGSDWGRDADLGVSDSDPIRVAITSSRSIQGARANLRSAIESLVAHGLPGRRIISVSLAVVSQSQRVSLASLAGGLGFNLEQVIDRGFFADRLGQDGSWRDRLLGLPSAPFSLARASGVGLLDPLESLVGRSEDREAIQASTLDLVVWGPPGIGKSALMSNMDRTFFVEGRPSDGQLLNDILESSPMRLVVDDAMRRLQVVEQLQVIRKQDSPNFQIVAVCWPHEREHLLALMPDARSREVEPLVRAEIVEIISRRGVSSVDAQHRILQQAHGRPGWARRLAELVASDATWRSVYSGEAVAAEIKNYLVRSGLPAMSSHLLAVCSAIGAFDRDDFPRMSSLLGLSAGEFVDLLNDVAQGGLIDVHSRGADKIEFSVAPDILAASLVADGFFGATVSIASIEQLCGLWPDRVARIALRVLQVALIGVESAKSVARQLASAVLESSQNLAADEIARHLVHLGQHDAKSVIERLRARGTFDVELLSDVFLAHEELDVIADVVAGVQTMEASGSDGLAEIKRFVDAVRGFDSEQRVNLNALVRLGRRVIEMFGEGLEARIASEFMHQVLQPSFEATWNTPESRMSITMTSAALSTVAMDRLNESVWEPWMRAARALPNTALSGQIKLVRAWSHLAGGYTLSFGARPTKGQSKKARNIVVPAALNLYQLLSDSPGLRAVFREATRGLHLKLREADPLIALLFGRRRWKYWRTDRGEELKRRASEMLASVVNDPGGEGAALLRMLLREAEWIQPIITGNPIRLVLDVVADETLDLLGWIDVCLDFQLFPDAWTVLRRALDEGNLDSKRLDLLMQNPRSRGQIIDHYFCREAGIPEWLDSALTLEDLAELHWAIGADRLAAPHLVRLLSHPNRQIAALTALFATDFLVSEGASNHEAVGHWRSALESLRFEHLEHIDRDHDLLRKLVVGAPDRYETLVVEGLGQSGQGWKNLRVFEESLSRLENPAKSRILAVVQGEWWLPNVFKMLRGSDLEWPVELIRRGTVDADLVLHSIDGEAQDQIVEAALKLVPLGVDPARVADRVQYGSYIGEDHERIAGYLSLFDRMIEHSDQSVQAVGRAGQARFRSALEDARREARRRDV